MCPVAMQLGWHLAVSGTLSQEFHLEAWLTVLIASSLSAGPPQPWCTLVYHLSFLT